MSNHTFLWHDYETFGAVPRRDRPAQFAAIRTDAELNEIGEPIMLFCQPANDYLPDPVACLILALPHSKLCSRVCRSTSSLQLSRRPFRSLAP